MRKTSYQLSKLDSPKPHAIRGGERKVMKKSLSLILAIALVFSMFTPMAFAADQSAGEYLAEVGIIKGSLSGDLMENETWKRQDITVILSRLVGAEAEALAYPKAHTFADVTDPFYDGYISWAKGNGYFEGHSSVRFGYDEEITKYDFLAVMLRALGVDTKGANYANVPQLAYEAGLIASPDEDLSVAATRGEYYEIIVTTLNVEVEEGVTLGAKLGLPGFVTEEPEAPAALEVEEAYAPNLIQVVVEYNQDVTDNAEAAKADNYSVKDGKIVAVDVDGSTVTLTLEKKFDQQTTKVLTIGEKILGAKEEIEVRFFDTTVPEAVSAEVIGKNTIKVTFSEPINASVLDTRSKKREGFSLKDADGKNVYVDDVTFAKNNREANVSFYTTFKEGEYTLSVTNAYQDYAGFKVAPTEFTVDVVVDNAAPEIVGYKDAKPYSVTLIFNEDIVVLSNDEDDFYHTNTKNAVKEVPVANGNELTLKFNPTEKMPAGTVYVYIGGDAISDLWDNKNKQQLRVAIEVEGDETPPVITKVEADGQDAVKVTFNESLDESSAENADNYKLFKADGSEDVGAITSATLQSDNDKVVRLEFNGNKSGDLTLKVDGVKDIYGNAMKDFEFDFFMQDVTPVVLANITAKLYVDGSIQRLVIDYGEPMAVEGDYSVLDLKKYRFSSGPNDKVFSKIKGIKAVATSNGQVVEITIDTSVSGFDEDDAFNAVTNRKFEIAVSQIEDAAGNRHDIFDQSSHEVTITAVSSIGFTSAKAIDKRTIEVELSEALEVFDDKDFYLSFGSADGSHAVSQSVYSYRVNDSTDGKKIIFALNFDLSATAKVDGQTLYVHVEDSDVDSANVYGTKVDSTAVIDVTDGIKPTITGIAQGAGNTIVITVSEGVYAVDATLAATDFIITKPNGTALVAGTATTGDYYISAIATTAGGAVNTIEITLHNAPTTDLTVKTVDAPKYVKDAAGNLLSKYNGAKLDY
jgi:hypothetical protein